MYILYLLLLIVLVYLVLPYKETFTQDYYPHFYSSNMIPCSSSIKQPSLP